MARRLFLASNTVQHGLGPLEHCLDAVGAHFAGARRIAFCGFAKRDQDAYLAFVKPPFDALGIEVVSAHTGVALAEVDGCFVGGGNTFLLVKRLYETGWIDDLRAAIPAGLPYLGSSAGTNIAAPTLCTTNDMPIVQPPSFDTLGVVPFQINPHYLDPDPTSTHKGETREQRLAEYHEHHARPVVGLREGSWLTVHGDQMVLRGPRPARVFRPGAAEEVPPDTDLSALL